MVDISSQNNKINITVSSSGNTANTNITPDYAQYYSEKSKEWAISNKIVDNIDYSSKYYANESKKQADISTAKAEEVVASGNTAVTNIESARDNAITNVNTAGAIQVALATEQATIATNKASEVVESGNTALSNIDTAKNNAITSITNQETTSKSSLIDEGATQIGLIQNEGATQVANVQSTGFYMRDDKLYFINSQGEETEFKSGGSGLEVCDIGMALYVDETKGLRRYLNGQIVDINANTQAFLDRLLQIKTTNPDYFTTEDNWQTEATLNVDGCVYKFVLNYASDGETVVSVRLPKYPDYIEVSVLKLKLRYFIQIATGSETKNNIINDIELNNPFSLFDSKYSDHELNNLSWLKSEGQWNAKAVYPDAYDKILENVNKGTKGFLGQTMYMWGSASGGYMTTSVTPVVGSAIYNYGDKKYAGSVTAINSETGTISFTDTVNNVSYTDVARYSASDESSSSYITDYDFVLNTANETFRLPLKTKLASGKAVVGNGNNLGLTDGNQYYIPNLLSTSYNPMCVSSSSGSVPVGYGALTGAGGQAGVALGITTDPTKSGIELSDSGLYLYYYVGETAQNANLIDAGRIGEQLTGKVDVSNTQWATNACMPDYDNGIAIGTANKYEALVDGYYVGRATVASGTNSTTRITAVLYNNSETLAVVFSNSGYDNNSGNSKYSTINFPVPKGYKITVTDILGSLITSNFYPMKGAN